MIINKGKFVIYKTENDYISFWQHILNRRNERFWDDMNRFIQYFRASLKNSYKIWGRKTKKIYLSHHKWHFFLYVTSSKQAKYKEIITYYQESDIFWVLYNKISEYIRWKIYFNLIKN